MKKKLLLFLALICFAPSLISNTCSTNAGTFASWLALTWTCTGAPAGGPPGCGDVMNISSGTTVNISADVDYSACASPIQLNIYGTMNFNVNGVRFKLPPGSSVFLGSGGWIHKTFPGGGSSTLISVGGENIWTAGMGSIGGPQTLPIELLGFTVKSLSDNILVEWSTATEIHNDFFTIERSSDGISFQEIGFVDGAGNSTTVLNYAFSDLQPIIGMNYYRLKQTDYDGNYSYSKIIYTDFNSSDDFSFNLFPNPNAGDVCFISFSGISEQVVEITVVDILGRVVFGKSIIIKTQGENIFSLDPEIILEQGVYSVTAKLKDNAMSKRWLVQ